MFSSTFCLETPRSGDILVSMNAAYRVILKPPREFNFMSLQLAMPFRLTRTSVTLAASSRHRLRPLLTWPQSRPGPCEHFGPQSDAEIFQSAPCYPAAPQSSLQASCLNPPPDTVAPTTSQKSVTPPEVGFPAPGNPPAPAPRAEATSGRASWFSAFPLSVAAGHRTGGGNNS